MDCEGSLVVSHQYGTNSGISNLIYYWVLLVTNNTNNKFLAEQINRWQNFDTIKGWDFVSFLET